MIEKIIENAKTGLAVIVLGIGMYNCASAKVNSPITEYSRIKEKECYDLNGNKKEINCVYPVIIVKF